MDKRRVNVRAIIWRDGKLLAVKQRNTQGEEQDYWCVIGGGLDPHESLQDGLRREVMEEVGAEATVGKLLFIQQFASTRNDYDEELEFLFAVENVDDFDDIDLTKTTHGMEEIARVEWIDPATTDKLLPAFLQTVPLAEYVTTDKPVSIVSHL